ncbi:MAG: SDR family oxidoreductase [Gammaproteobacteria bacterium]|nr:SDR family oxidoreductase [Gammaproteobacteria bacterium]
MTNSININDKVAVVTGANRGIGKTIAESFLENGAKKIYAAVRDTSSASDLIEKYGNRVSAIKLDLADPQTITNAAKTANDAEIIVNNAGVLTSTTPLDNNALESLNFEMDINVGGLIRMAQAFAPVLKQNGGGALIQLNSVASIKNFVPFTTYSASKAAAYSVTQSLRDLLSEQGTSVMSVHPGPIATDMGDAAGLSEIAEPATLVSDAIIKGLQQGEFHVFPDTMAKQVEGEYQNFAKNIVEANLMEG